MLSLLFISMCLSMKGKQGCGINEEDNPALGNIFSECVPIYPDEDNLYEILFDNYMFHMDYDCEK